MDISIIEFIVYGLVTYSGILMLLVSTIKEVPTSRVLAIVRSIYFILPVITAIILAGSGVNIVTQETTNTIVALNTTEVWTETVSQQIVLRNPVWVGVHFLMAAVMAVYVIQQMLILLTKV